MATQAKLTTPAPRRQVEPATKPAPALKVVPESGTSGRNLKRILLADRIYQATRSVDGFDVHGLDQGFGAVAEEILSMAECDPHDLTTLRHLMTSGHWLGDLLRKIAKGYTASQEADESFRPDRVLALLTPHLAWEMGVSQIYR